MLVFVAGALLVVVLVIAALLKRVEFVIGLTIGLALAAIGAAAAPSLEGRPIPIWLPPVPFALVATSLFVFAGLAWWWGTDR